MSKRNPYAKSDDPHKRSLEWIEYEHGVMKAKCGLTLADDAPKAMRLGYDDAKAVA